MTDEEFAQEHSSGKSKFAEFLEEAQEYARSITNPQGLNWVRVDWIWF
jgi:hypothetical protein